VILTPQEDTLYLGKLAVAHAARGQGLARRLIALSLERARALGLATVSLQTRVELLENHATFAALGFEMTGTTAHPGYDRPTSVSFRRAV
jgi:predicted N-acetyltransferase YhbS